MGQKVVGQAYQPGYGMCIVEATDRKDWFVVRPIRHQDIRYWVHRSRVQWRRMAVRKEAT